ncbi:MAG: zinc ABC transporter substrate-binding protein [Alphaproteobacteria bacterium]
MISRRSFTGGMALALVTQPVKAQARPLNVVTTTAMLADAVRTLSGDRVRVEGLMGEGVDPHLYRPSRADIARLTQADLIIAHGLGLEAQFRDTFVQIGRQKPVVFAAEAVPKDRLLKDEEVADKPDPHVWMDPSLWAVVVQAVAGALSTRAPQGRTEASPRITEALAEMTALSGYARDVLTSVPPDRRVLVTAHDAFGYLARAYGFTVKGIQGLSTESEAGLKTIEATVDMVVNQRIPAIFVESSVSDRNIKAVVEGAARRGHRVAVGAELFSDAMGKPGSYEGTYLGMIDHNVTAIARALGGMAPARGRLGRLTAPL